MGVWIDERGRVVRPAEPAWTSSRTTTYGGKPPAGGPMVLITFFFSLTGRFAMHRRIARFTFPIWLYVSITGVVVFAFLKAYAY